MKTLFQLLIIVSFSSHAYTQGITDSVARRESLDKATAAIREAFEKVVHQHTSPCQFQADYHS